MPRTTHISPALNALLSEQDGIVTAAQLIAHGVGRTPISHRVRQGRWRWLLPGVLLTQSGYPTRRQRVVAAWLWAGPDAAIDGESACYWYGVGQVPPDKVHVVVPWSSPARSQSFVVVRRTIGEITVGAQTTVPYVDAATALLVAARGAKTERAAIALLSRGLQVGLISEGDLFSTRRSLGSKWCARVDVALAAVGVGVRSPAEHEAQRLIDTSRELPSPLWNQWLDLSDGQGLLCADALWTEAGMLHETNGRRYHAWDTSFEDMQSRHDRLTAAGLIVLHNAPTRIRRDGPSVLRELERTYRRYCGRGLPSNVRLVDPPRAANCG